MPILARGGVICHANVGAYTCIAANAMIGGMEHDYRQPSINPLLNSHCIYGKTTHIGKDVWIGANCVIRQGVTIGDGAVIGAGSVVTRDVPENSIAFGSPAKIHKQRFAVEEWQQVKASKYWDSPLKRAKESINQLITL